MSIPTIHPLLYDALSGEFRPESDPKNTHTLGRLAIAAFQKGEITGPETTSTQGGTTYGLEYKPSWAPDVSAGVICHTLRGYTHLSCLVLRREVGPLNDNSLLVSVETLGGDTTYLNLALPGSERYTMPLNLGKSLHAARAAITQAAQTIFS